MIKGYRYLLKVPNNEYGYKVIMDLKRNLNHESYKIRLKGSHLSDKRIREFNPNITQAEIRDIKRWRNDVGSMLLRYCDYLRIYIDQRR